MAKMYLSFLLTFNQPMPQDPRVVSEIIQECYLPLIELFGCDMHPRFTVSFSHSLVRLISELGKADAILDSLRRSSEDGRVEIVHSGAYHPIFPLIAEREVVRQIEADVQSKAEHFGVTQKAGILSPEFCYEDRLLRLFQNLGFTWTIVDDQVMGMHGVHIPEHEIYQVGGFCVFMRSSLWSDKIRQPDEAGRYLTGKRLVQQLEEEISHKDRDSYKVIALSAETFGHHVKYYQETLLRDMLFALERSRSVRLCSLSDLLKIDSLHRTEKHRQAGRGFEYFPPCSWATRPEDSANGDPYPLWKAHGNPIHERLWSLTDLILNACQRYDLESDPDLRGLLDQAFYSAQYFWASIWFWNPKLIHEGVDLQMRALYRYARRVNDKRALNAGERLYAQLMWEIHKRGQEEEERRR